MRLRLETITGRVIAKKVDKIILLEKDFIQGFKENKLVVFIPIRSLACYERFEDDEEFKIE